MRLGAEPRAAAWRHRLVASALLTVPAWGGAAVGAATAGADEGQTPPPQALQALVPTGQELLAWARADLDRDGRPDFVFVLQSSGSHPFDGDRGDAPRSLQVARSDRHGRLRVVARNNTLVRCQNCGGTWPEPFDGLRAWRGGFEVSHYGGSRWRWSDAWAFGWSTQRRAWLLQRRDEGADTEAEGHLVRRYRRSIPFGALRLQDVSGEVFLTHQLWPRVRAPRPWRDENRS